MIDITVTDTIKVKRSFYFPCTVINNFAFGDLVRLNLNSEDKWDDIGVVEGIRFEEEDNLWLYRVKVIINLAHLWNIEELTYKPFDVCEVSGNCLKVLTLQDIKSLIPKSDRFSDLELEEC